MRVWLAIALLVTQKSAMHWLIHLGGPGLILLGIADNSLIPLPGSTDIVTILLPPTVANRGSTTQLCQSLEPSSAAFSPIAWRAKAARKLSRKGSRREK